jgi:hypothetical protein
VHFSINKIYTKGGEFVKMGMNVGDLQWLESILALMMNPVQIGLRKKVPANQ